MYTKCYSFLIDFRYTMRIDLHEITKNNEENNCSSDSKATNNSFLELQN